MNLDITWWQLKSPEYLHCLDEIYHTMGCEVLSSIFKRKNISLDDQAHYIFMALYDYNWKFTLNNMKCWQADVCKHFYIGNVIRNPYGEDSNGNQEVPVWTKTVTKS